MGVTESPGKHSSLFSIIFLQDRKKCSPKGQDCIERNSALTFNCSGNCEGIYADVQWSEEGVKEKGIVGEKGLELDKKKYITLLSEYRYLKEGIVQHFMFNDSTSPHYGKLQIQLRVFSIEV